MKYRAVAIVSVILAAAIIGNGLLNKRRIHHQATALKSTVSSMSLQELAARAAECESAPPPGARPLHDAAYCEEVMRALDNQPLELVKVPPK